MHTIESLETAMHEQTELAEKLRKQAETMEAELRIAKSACDAQGELTQKYQALALQVAQSAPQQNAQAAQPKCATCNGAGVVGTPGAPCPFCATPAAKALREAESNAQAALSDGDVQWIVNDNAELGVKIGDQFFFLYKGHSLVYKSGQHDDGSPLMWRPVGKREFGECCHPVNYNDLTKWGTVSLDDGNKWLEVLAASQQPAAAPSAPALTVWYGPMPESNGAQNFTATLTRKGAVGLDRFDGFTFSRSEYPDRVRYEADCMRHLIGELDKEPDLLDYDETKHSGYAKPATAPAIQQEGAALDGDLLPCPFCGVEMHFNSNRDWHRIDGDHLPDCVFSDVEDAAMMVPATKDGKAWAVTAWNRRTTLASQASKGAGVQESLVKLPWTDESTADPVTKAHRVLKGLIDGSISYFFHDGFPRDDIAKDAKNVLAVIEALAAPSPTQANAGPSPGDMPIDRLSLRCHCPSMRQHRRSQ